MTSDQARLETSVRRLDDELRIHNVLARLSHLADSGDIDEYLALWAPDGVWEGSADTARGTAELRARVERYRALGIQGPGSNTRHVSTTRYVDLQGPDAARAESYFIYFTETSTHPQATRVGRYVDELARLDGQWRLARRRIVLQD
jgi:3-phenylpropionate/cinnamic acid dioxygenase small subunit